MSTRRRLSVLLGAGLLTFSLFGATASVLAVGEKVTICHATNSETHPYVEETVDIASSGAFEGYLKAGHAFHTGPVWYPGAKADKVKWGDIVPSYYYEPKDFTFDGLNWTEGQEILEDGCVVEGEPVEAFIVTEVHLGASDDGDAVIVDDANPAIAGDSVHDSARLQFPGDGEIPGESAVQFSFWNNHDCEGEPDTSSELIVVSGETSPVLLEDGLPQGPLDEGLYSYRADFMSGNDEIVDSATGECEPFTVIAFEESQDAFTEPPSDAFGAKDSSGPADGAWLLVVALGVLLASVVVLTPARAKSRR